MTHWTTQFLSRKYVPGAYDCLDLVREAVAAVRGIEIALPDKRSFRQWNKASAEAEFSDLAVETSMDEAEDGDLVLMRIRGRRRDLGSHVGVYVQSRYGLNLVLHCVQGVGVRINEAAAMASQGRYEIVGVYKWLS